MIFADSGGEKKETIGTNLYASWLCAMTGTYVTVPSYFSNPTPEIIVRPWLETNDTSRDVPSDQLIASLPPLQKRGFRIKPAV
jgi:hypothetical protein